MHRVFLLRIAPALVLLYAFACSGSQTPGDVMAAANRNLFTDKDYEGALALYDQVLHWNGAEAPTATQRFEASLNTIRCRIFLGRTEGVKEALDQLRKEFGDRVTYKNYCTVIGDLEKQKALKSAIDVLIEAGKSFPAYKERFQQEAKKLERLGLSNEDLERLKTLGYL